MYEGWGRNAKGLAFEIPRIMLACIRTIVRSHTFLYDYFY
jgi:hypothetical protein